MKKNTQRLLLALYFLPNFKPGELRNKTEDDTETENEDLDFKNSSLGNRGQSGGSSFNGAGSGGATGSRIKLSNLNVVIPNLTEGGKRSLLHVLKKNGLINSERVLGTTSIGITQHGIKALEDQFPALSSKWDAWTDNWDCLVFTQAPKSDKQFRYLRTLLVSEGAVSISRGVYASPFSFSERVTQECSDMYRDSILMFSVGSWKIASLRSLVIERYGLLDVVESYSGISNDVSRLLTSVDTNNRLLDRHKIEINLVYDRLVDVLQEDPGFCQHYFKESPKIKEILSKLNLMISAY